MIIVGLTGSIGMGKSTTAEMFAALGAPVYDADAEVRRLYAKGGAAVAPVEAEFPGVAPDGAIDRVRLADRVLGDQAALARLNAIVWPLMSGAREAFFQRAQLRGAAIVVLDIPLLLETGGEKNVGTVVVVSAPPDLQSRRVLNRPDMTPAKFASILAAQMPDSEKRTRADFVVDTSLGLEAAREQVAVIVRTLLDRSKQAR